MATRTQLPAPPSVNGNGSNGNGTSTHDPADPSSIDVSVVRIRTFPNTMDVLHVLRFLRESASNGKLTINLSRGGIGTIQFEERQKVNNE